MKMINSERGFTIIELLASMAISSLILGTLVPSIFQVIRHTDNNTTRTTAVNQIENAARWLSRDIQAAQYTNLIEGTPVNMATLYWTDWTDWSGGDGRALPGDFIDHSVTYSLAREDLQRTYDGINTTIIARHISDITFSLSGNMITVTIVSSPRGPDWPTESRTYDINIRPTDESLAVT